MPQTLPGLLLHGNGQHILSSLFKPHLKMRQKTTLPWRATARTPRARRVSSHQLVRSSRHSDCTPQSLAGYPVADIIPFFQGFASSVAVKDFGSVAQWGDFVFFDLRVFIKE